MALTGCVVPFVGDDGQYVLRALSLTRIGPPLWLPVGDKAHRFRSDAIAVLVVLGMPFPYPLRASYLYLTNI